MKSFYQLAFLSLWYRRTLSFFILLILILNFSLLLAFDKLANSLHHSFTGVSGGVDLIVGAPTGALNLVLYTLFNVGSVNALMDYQEYKKWSQHPAVQWALPISLGDSHRQFRVVGTSALFFDNFKARSQSLQFEQGKGFAKDLEVVIGYQVARSLNYQVGHQLLLSHGAGSAQGSFLEHGDYTFTVAGILAETASVLDHQLFISLKAMDLIHAHQNEEPVAITATFLKLNSRIETLKLQREINENVSSPLLAVLPTATLSELWRALDFFEKIFVAMGGVISLVSVLALIFILIYWFESRLPEWQVLRSVGASKKQILILLWLEYFTLMVLSLLVSLVIYTGLYYLIQSRLIESFSILLSENAHFSLATGIKLLAVVAITSHFPVLIAFFRLNKN